jgi:two-component SAPR family response regulator
MNVLSLGGASVLIVEDNFVVADALRYLIDGYGGSVSAIVPNLQRAHEALAAGPVDIAVLDINLNGTSVVPFAEHLRARGVPFVFLSGYGGEELLPEHLRGHPRFDKPVEAERLVRAMLHLTRRPPEPND